MGECPAGYELSNALGGMCCKHCACQCMIRYLKNEIEDLENKMLRLERSIK